MDVAAFDVALPEGWHPIPLDDPSGQWPAQLAEQIAPEEARERLVAELTQTAEGTRAFADARTTAAVFVEFPERGHVSGMFACALTDVADIGGIEGMTAALRAEQAASDSTPFHAQVWTDEAPAGPLVAGHLLLAHPGGQLEERVVVVVFPPEAAQAVQIVATAAGLGDFPDMPAAILPIAASLRVQLEEAA